jgi:hypothetical protein
MIGWTLYFRHIRSHCLLYLTRRAAANVQASRRAWFVFDPRPAGMAMENESAGAAARPFFWQIGDKEFKLATGKQQARSDQ